MEDIKDDVDPEIFELIEVNWDRDPENRMNFRDIIPTLEKLLSNSNKRNFIA